MGLAAWPASYKHGTGLDRHKTCWQRWDIKFNNHILFAYTSYHGGLQALATIIKEGWPERKSDVPKHVQEYCHCRDVLSVYDGTIFRSERLVVLQKMRAEMLRKAQASHQGLEASFHKVRGTFYWPCMKDDVERKVSICTIYQEFPAGQPHMKMQMHEVPDLPWKRVATDVFQITIHYSDYWEIDALPSTTWNTTTLITDNATYFISAEFQVFSRTWDFQHSTSAPYHPWGNGKAEASVKIAKNIMKKCLQIKSDPWFALLEWRNIPMSGLRTSPVQRLMSRTTRT
ncbi:hypothetical protein PR048_021506 [Dryococelus australis]|uniref:RNA-directed DNA polymerase n=1 Tax=Dryococelus australis TaxID=614101 RepID=A0ABQ9GYE0_9NEOP|nr:hypothetical protein PR048_021506 [Dryococelus australis]